jgi:hypothetical protein
MKSILEIQPGSPLQVPSLYVIAGLLFIFTSLTKFSIYNIEIEVFNQTLLLGFGVISLVIGTTTYFLVYKSLLDLERWRKLNIFLAFVLITLSCIAAMQIGIVIEKPAQIVQPIALGRPTPIPNTTQVGINIAHPTNGSSVTFYETLYGNSTGVYGSGLHLYVLINPVATNDIWWVLPEAEVYFDSTWKVYAQFGRSGQEDVGAKYWVTSIVTSDVLYTGPTTIYPSHVKAFTKPILLTRV